MYMFLHHCTCRCVGTVTQYCGSSDEHFVVFDEDCLQSQWMVITADSTDVLLGVEEERKAGDDCVHALYPFDSDCCNLFLATSYAPTTSRLLIPRHVTLAMLH